ncbi:MAG: hypothetical protein WD972_03795 [Candidatus Andersenbacteria bacterium]
MMGPYGLYQHATVREPLLSEGYCLDDNTRAVQTLLGLQRHSAPEDQAVIEDLLERCWNFIMAAQEQPGRYYNFQSSDGEWLPHGRSDDMYARLFRVVLTVMNEDQNLNRRRQAEQILKELLPILKELTSPRALAEIAIAVNHAAPAQREQWELTTFRDRALKELTSLWQTNADGDWRWFESRLTYANAFLPHALLGEGASLPQSETEAMLHEATKFLITATMENTTFVPIGSNGWYDKGGTPSRDNQQPIEAGTMLDFLLEYQAAFPKEVPREVVAAPYVWFFGKNTNAIVMADETSGACLDGIFRHGPNPNCGAESMLAYLWAEVRLAEAPPEIRDYAYSERAKLLRQKTA